jgi:hypothetical protein
MAAAWWVEFLIQPGYCLSVYIQTDHEDDAKYKAAFKIGQRFGQDLDMEQLSWRSTKRAE